MMRSQWTMTLPGVLADKAPEDSAPYKSTRKSSSPMRFDTRSSFKVTKGYANANLNAHWFERLLTNAYRPLAAGLFSLALLVPAWAAVQTNITFPVSGTSLIPASG